MQNYKPDVVKDKHIVEENYVIFGDSNTNEIKTELLNKRFNTNIKRVCCPYFDAVMAYCDKAIVMEQPIKMMIHWRVQRF